MAEPERRYEEPRRRPARVQREKDYDLPKDKTNPRFQSKYTSLDKMVEVVTRLLAKHGLVWITFPNGIAHGTHARLQADPRRNRRGDRSRTRSADARRQVVPAGEGSAITYARRYALSSVLNVSADEDDDGNTADDAKPSAQLKSGQQYGQMPETGEAATDPQKKKIRGDLSRAGAKGWDIQHAIYRELFGKDLPQGKDIADVVTKAQAGRVIDRVKQGALPTGVSDVPADDAPTVEQPKLGDDEGVPF